MAPPTRTQAGDYHYHAYDFVGSTTPWGLSAAQPARNNYQFYSLLQDLSGLHQYGLATLNVPNIALTLVGAALQDDVTAVPFNVHTFALSFGNRNNLASPPTIIFTGGIHAREWIAHEFVYLLAEYLIMHYDPGPVYASDYEQSISQLIDNQRIVIVPMLNPVGNYATVFGAFANARMWRKNRHLLPTTVLGWQTALNHVPFQNIQNPNPTTITYQAPLGTGLDTITLDLTQQYLGVDVNRNFDTPMWGTETRPSTNIRPGEGIPTSESYFGTNHNSETEAQNVATLLATLTNNGVSSMNSIDYHSYGKMILYPTERAVGDNMTEIGKGLRQLIVTAIPPPTPPYDYQLGTPLTLLGYNAYSTVMDYLGNRFNSLSFTIELDPANPPPPNPGFQLPETAIMGVFEKNIRAALLLIATVGLQSRGVWNQLFTQSRAAQVAAILSNWDVFNRGNQLPA